MNKNIDSNGKGTTSGNTVAWSVDGSNANGPVTALSYLKNNTSGWTKLEEDQIILPSAEQITKASGKTFNGDRVSDLSTWLYENLYINNSVPYAYWTSTPSASYSQRAWYVNFDGILRNLSVDDGGTLGVRPVITLLKSQL